MALISCPRCGKPVSDRAKTCPKCGCPVGYNANVEPQRQSIPEKEPQSSNRNKSGSSGVLWLILIFGIIALIIFLLSGKACTGTSDEMISSSCDTSASAVFLSDDAVDSVAYEELSDVEITTDNEISAEPEEFNCHSEDIYPTEEYVDYSGSPIDGKCGKINSVWLEHDVNGGLRIHVNMDTYNLLNQKVEVSCYFFFKDGRQVKSTDGQYESPEHQVSTTTFVTPDYQGCHWDDLQLWIPYSQIKRVRDRKDLKCRVQVFYNHHCIASGNYMNFACWLD